MYQAKVTFEGKSQDETDDFDFDIVVTYRNIKTREMVDGIAGSVAKGLMELGGVFTVAIEAAKKAA